MSQAHKVPAMVFLSLSSPLQSKTSLGDLNASHAGIGVNALRTFHEVPTIVWKHRVLHDLGQELERSGIARA